MPLAITALAVMLYFPPSSSAICKTKMQHWTNNPALVQSKDIPDCKPITQPATYIHIQPSMLNQYTHNTSKLTIITAVVESGAFGIMTVIADGPKSCT